MEFTTEFNSGFPPQEGYYLVLLKPGLTNDKRYDVDWFQTYEDKGEWVAYYAHNILAWAELPTQLPTHSFENGQWAENTNEPE